MKIQKRADITHKARRRVHRELVQPATPPQNAGLHPREWQLTAMVRLSHNTATSQREWERQGSKRGHDMVPETCGKAA